MSLLHPTIRDDNGKRLGLAFTSPFEQLGKGTERGKRLQEAGWRLQRPPTSREWGRLAFYSPFILPLILAAGLAPSMISRLGLPLWTMPVAILPMALVPVTVTITVMRLALREQFASVYLLAGYCASCAYDLRSAECDERGRRVCPECGGVWRQTEA